MSEKIKKMGLSAKMILFKKISFIVSISFFLVGCAAKVPYLKLDPSLQSCVKTIEGYKYLPLSKLCDVYGITCSWDAFTRTASLKVGSSSMILRCGSQTILINGSAKKIDRPVTITSGTVYIPASFVRNDIIPLVLPKPVPRRKLPVIEKEKKFTIKTIVLDTGHGGRDAGAMGHGRGTKEKNIALTLSERVKALLEDAGICVIMTRKDDVFLALPKRCDIANNSKADIFMSIHINASFSHSMRGFECYYLSNATDDNARALEAFENSSLRLDGDADIAHSKRLNKTLWDMTLTENRKESAELAGLICQSVDESQLLKNNGVKTAKFFVLKHTHIPSVLVEAGYISNGVEESKLRDARFLDRMAEAIVRGILRYKKRYEDTDGFTNV